MSLRETLIFSFLICAKLVTNLLGVSAAGRQSATGNSALNPILHGPNQSIRLASFDLTGVNR
jgi:hypothetical protein